MVRIIIELAIIFIISFVGGWYAAYEYVQKYLRGKK